jgi:hypothetical protein
MLKEPITDEWLKELLGSEHKFVIYDETNHRKHITFANRAGQYGQEYVSYFWYAFMYEKSFISNTDGTDKHWDNNDATISNSLKYKHEVLFLLDIVGWSKNNTSCIYRRTRTCTRIWFIRWKESRTQKYSYC